MVWFSQPPESIAVCETYIQIVMFGTFLNMQFEAVRRFLFAQGILSPVRNILLFDFLIQLIGLYVLVIHLEKGVMGKNSYNLPYYRSGNFNNDYLHYEFHTHTYLYLDQ